MSKSTGNFLTIQQVIKQHHPEVVRYFLLSSHYRSPLNYTDDQLYQAKQALTRLYQAIRHQSRIECELDQAWIEKFFVAMNDDFNTPIALAVLFDLSHTVNKTSSPVLVATLRYLADLLGLLQWEPEQFLQSSAQEHDPLRIEELIEKRTQARALRDWQRADEIRDLLLSEGIELEDSTAGTRWRVS